LQNDSRSFFYLSRPFSNSLSADFVIASRWNSIVLMKYRNI
jgi:hypothetical protein